MQLFERGDIERLLGVLAHRLADAGVTGTISIVGGAAISLEYLVERDATTDIDAILPQHPLVSTVIQEIADEEALNSDWVNDAVTAYVPFETSQMWRVIMTVESISIRIATAELLLAMKLKADRGLRDRGDIEGLIRLMEIRDITEVHEIYEKYHHQEVLSDRTRLVVEQLLQEY
jgi:hypothetical protein